MNAFVQTMKGLGPARLASMAGVGIGLLGFIIFFAIHFSSRNVDLLFGDMEPEAARQVVAELETMNIPYELKNNGADVYVPNKEVSKLRLRLSEFAAGGGTGYEIFDETDALGATNFIQNVNLVRALEGELSRTIRALDGIKDARVHLVLPKREMFSRQEQKPTASVVVKSSGGKIKQKQVTSIQHLVSSAVPKMEAKDVTIVDEKGMLLTREYSDDEEMIRVTNEERRRDYERRMAASVTSLLEKSVGMGKVRAEVTVEMDFDHVVLNEELYDPEGQVVRSTVTVEENASAQEQDPNAVSVGADLPDASLGADGTTSANQQARTEETVNYEISKKVINQVKDSGSVRRISVAVLVDGLYTKDAEGNKKYEARSNQEMELLAALVKSAMGYDKERGDQVEVVNMRFVDFEDMFEPEKPVFMNFTKEEVMRMAEGMSVALVAILVILLVIRPLVNKAFETSAEEDFDQHMLEQMGAAPQLMGPGGESLEGMGTDELIDIAKVEGRVKASSLRKISEIIDGHPDEALSIIRTWLYQDS